MLTRKSIWFSVQLSGPSVGLVFVLCPVLLLSCSLSRFSEVPASLSMHGPGLPVVHMSGLAQLFEVSVARLRRCAMMLVISLGSRSDWLAFSGEFLVGVPWRLLELHVSQQLASL
ncbi:hypothetical protein FKM82_026611 [Ascaphus truei]